MQSATAPVAPPQKTKLEIVENVRNLSRFFRSVIDLADAVGDVDALERAANEAEARMAQKRAEEAEIDARVAHKVDAAVKAEQKKADHQREAQQIVSEAKKEAEGIRSLARADATKIAAEAARQADVTAADARNVVAAAQKEADDLLAAAAAQRNEVQHAVEEESERLADLGVQVKAKAAELAELEKKIDALKRQAGKILGV